MMQCQSPFMVSIPSSILQEQCVVLVKHVSREVQAGASTWQVSSMSNAAGAHLSGLWRCCVQYHTKIDAIVDQAQYPGSSAEGAWFCTL